MITIRPARPEDAATIAAIYAPYVLAGTVSFETDAPDARGMKTRMAASHGLYPWLVATTGDGDGEDEAVLGYAYATSFKDRPAYRWTVETTIYVSGAVQGQGTGQLLYTSRSSNPTPAPTSRPRRPRRAARCTPRSWANGGGPSLPSAPRRRCRRC